MTLEINGLCDSAFEKIKDAFHQNFMDRLEVGASCAVTVEGEFVVDIWAGHKDVSRTKPWDKDTLVSVFSSTKAMSVLCAHVLMDRGLIDMDQPVATYWPEFAQNGKERLFVKYVLSHTSGLPGWDAPITMKDLYDWGKVTGLLVDQKPWWEPGTLSGYHRFTQGYMIGELVRRITGKSIGTFFKEELAERSGADFHIGLAAEHDHRVADIIPPSVPETGPSDPTSIPARILYNPLQDPALSYVKSRGWLGSEIPSGNGQGNARSMARIGSIVACGGILDGNKYLSSDTIEESIKEQIYGTDLVLGPFRWGLGWALPSKEIPMTANWETRRACFIGGAGGSILLMDLDARTCFAYAMNKMSPTVPGDPRTARLIRVLYECLGEGA